MSEEGEIRGRLLLDSTQFRREVEEARAQLDQLTGTRTDVRVGADVAGALADIRRIADRVDQIASRSPTIRIRTEGGDEATRSLRSAADAADRLARAKSASERATQVARLAQLRLNEVLNNEKRTTLQLASAQEALRFATQNAERAARAADVAEGGLTNSHQEATRAALADAAAQRVLNEETRKTGKSAEGAAGNIALLVAGAIALVPALFPVAGVAVAGAGALGGLGAAALLAGTGVARGLKDGSAAYQAWRPIVNNVLDDLHQLQDTAAAGVLPGVEQTFTRLQMLLPEADRGISEIAADLGRMLPTGLDAVVTLIERGAPLWRLGADELGRMVDAVDQFAHSNGYSDFIDYTIQNAPNVERFLTQLVQLVGDVVTAFAPWGSAVLPAVTDLVGALDWVVKVFGPALPVIAAGFAGWKVASLAIAGVTAAIDLVTASLAGMTIAEAIASDGLSLLAGAAAAGGAIALLASNGVKAPDATAAVGSTTTSKSSTAQPATSSMGGGDTSYNGFGAGPAPAAVKASTAAVNGQVAALDRAMAAWTALTAAQDKASKSAQSLEGTYDSARDAIDGVTAGVKDNGSSLDQNTAKGRANREEILTAVSAIKQHADAINADGKHTLEARIAQDKLAVQLLDTAAKAGISKQAAQEYINKLLGIPKNVSTVAQLKKDEAEAKLAAYKREVAALDGYTATVYVSLREVGLSASRAKQVAKNAALGNATGGTVGVDDLKHALKSIPAHASGATVRGPGTASSDSVLRWLSNGEEVTSNLRGQATANRPMLKAINSGDSALIARTAQQQYGSSAAPTVHVTVAARDGAPDLTDYIQVHVQQGLASQSAKNGRAARMGAMNKGDLASA